MKNETDHGEVLFFDACLPVGNESDETHPIYSELHLDVSVFNITECSTTYISKIKSNPDRYYVGRTINLKYRINKHDEGGVLFTLSLVLFM